MNITIAILILTNIFLVSLCYSNGYTFYNNRINKQKITPKVFDIGVKYVPDFSSNTDLALLSNAIAMLPPLYFGEEIFEEFGKYFIIIILIRGIFINVTILPKSPSCDDSKLNLIEGHCYDKIFSGHFASYFLLSLILYKRGIMGIQFLTISNVLHGLLIISLRHHYTVDIFTAIVVVLLVYSSSMYIQ